MKVVVWNMQHEIGNWTELASLEPDIALMCEAPRGYDPATTVALGSTEGRDDYERRWSTAVASRYGPREIVDAQATTRWGKTKRVPFESTRPGSWTAATVEVEGLGPVTAIALYGLMDEMSDSSVHRSLSEIAAIFDDPAHNHLILLGGDLNTSTAWEDEGWAARDSSVLDRIAAYGLVDCLATRRPAGRLAGCRCAFGESCTHTRTRRDTRYPDIPYQMDYLFASRALAERLETCEALSTDEWFQKSDHCPIVANFRGADS